MKRQMKVLAGFLCAGILAAGSIPVEAAQPQPDAAQEERAAGELILDDTSYDLDDCLKNWLGDSTVVKIGVSWIGAGQTTVPAQVDTVTGWQPGTFFEEEGEKQRTIGNKNIAGETFTFETGSDTIVRKIDFVFRDDKSLTIPEGAKVKFEECSFNNTIVNYGTAVFENCIFKNGKIENNGNAEYTGTTSEPENTGSSSEEHPEELAVSLEGELDCVTAGQNGYQDYLDVYVTEGEKEPVDYYEYSMENPDAKLTVTLSPEGSGMRAYWLFDSVVVAGTPEKAGAYQVKVTLEHNGQTVESGAKELRVYSGDETLKEQFASIDKDALTWDMEPYEIWNSDHAVVPVNLKTVYGSHESGLYGIIGNNRSLGTDTLTVPAGCHVTFENVKFYSSVKLIVEAGGSLTLTDSVAYGEVNVNGGTFSMNRDSALTDKLVLNDGSVLKDAEVESNHTFLSDGSQEREIPAAVIVNGTVTAEGTNVIRGDESASDEPGQTGLVVNGKLIIAQDSILTVQGGGDGTYVMGAGGTAVELNGGEITGEGKLAANGGTGVDAPGGDAIAGNGVISVKYLEANGGDSRKLLNKMEKGGDALGKEVLVTTVAPVLTGGNGNPAGSAELTRKPETPSVPEKPEGGETPDGNAGGNQTKIPGGTENGTNGDTGAAWSVKTGDRSLFILPLTGCGAAAAAAGVVLLKKRRK